MSKLKKHLQCNFCPKQEITKITLFVFGILLMVFSFEQQHALGSMAGKAYLSVSGIDVKYERSGSLEKIHLTQKKNIIDSGSIIINHVKIKCHPDDEVARCIISTSLALKFPEPEATMDMPTPGFPDVEEMIVESTTPSTSASTPSTSEPEKEGVIPINYKKTLIHKSFERFIDTADSKTRVQPEFIKKVQYEVKRANSILDGLCPKCNDESYNKINDIFVYEYPTPYESKLNDLEIQALLLSESLRAQKILDGEEN